MKIYLNDCAVVCALGAGKAAVRQAMLRSDGPHGVRQTSAYGWAGPVDTPVEALDDAPIALRSRCNGLLRLALRQLAPQGPDCAVVVGTSTSGVLHAEAAMRQRRQGRGWPSGYVYAQQEMGSPAQFVAQSVGARGPVYAISTACSSSAKALISAARLLRAGLADVVLAGGADALSDLTVQGFTALASVAAGRSNPFSVNRAGINIGEAAALFVVSRTPGPVCLSGWGESSDAHHISAPEPSGRATAAAMAQALRSAEVAASQVDYVNLHGTGTAQNDSMESHAMQALFPAGVPASSTKPLTGHTLGAAGALEAALCWLTLTHNPQGQLPPHWWDGMVDPGLPPVHLVRPGEHLGRPTRCTLSQSFAFGGNNAALLLEATP